MKWNSELDALNDIATSLREIRDLLKSDSGQIDASRLSEADIEEITRRALEPGFVRHFPVDCIASKPIRP